MAPLESEEESVEEEEAAAQAYGCPPLEEDPMSASMAWEEAAQLAAELANTAAAAVRRGGASAFRPLGAADVPVAAAVAEIAQGAPSPGSIDVDAWRGDLQRLHGTIDQVVQSFIASQTRQLDTVAAELASQRERVAAKERSFAELSDSIAGFVEEEAKRLEFWGVPLGDAATDARHEAYDAELPGPPALHRINRLWRKATRAFDAMKEAKELEAAKVLGDERRRLEDVVAQAEERCEALKSDHGAELVALQARLDEALGERDCKAGEADAVSQEAQALAGCLESARAELAETARRLELAETSKGRSAYEWDAEREELIRERGSAQAQAVELERTIADAQERERDLVQKCADRAGKLEQMRRIMDEQERDMTTKIDRVQQYVKERQASAAQAEQKQRDAERMADRWQQQVLRLQAEKDGLAKLVLDLEGQQTSQLQGLQGAQEQHQQEVARLQDSLRQREEDMRTANLELLQKRDDEYQAKVSLERQREKDRSIALLRKKEQEVQIKDQQLKAARQKIQELEGGGNAATAASPSPRSGSLGRRSMSGDACLPPLPLSAR